MRKLTLLTEPATAPAAKLNAKDGSVLEKFFLMDS